MKITRHLSMNIAGTLRNYKRRSMAGLLIDETGQDLSDNQVRDYLAECLAKGWVKIPVGNCDGFDHFGGGCPGHEIKEEQ